MTKYQEVFKNMLKNHQLEFAEFKKIHSLYEQDPLQHQQQFNQVGRDIQDIIRRYENILCSKSESAGYSKFSTQLSEKFHAEIKKMFPKIDHTGIE